MAILVAIEGADGAGKGTTARLLVDELNAAGTSATLISFPRYKETAAGAMIGQFLAGTFPVAVTPEAAAVLYALDRFESRAMLAEAADTHQVVVFDRYIASNMAYQAAKVDDPDAMLRWIETLETGQFALPRPDLSIYLDTPWEIAKALILQKQARSYTDRSYDEHEADAALQHRVRDNYRRIAGAGLLGEWRIVEASVAGAMRAPEAITAEIRNYLTTVPR